MIPVWLTPKIMKMSAIGLIIALIFGSGFWVSHKMGAAKIDRLKHRLDVIESNYSQCLDQNVIASDSIVTLEAAIVKQNQEYAKAAQEYSLKLAKQALESRRALDRYLRATQESEAKLEAEKADLMARMELLTASESCHEAWEEVVK